LSVQVHPTKAYQTKFSEATEKNEAWLILDAKEESSIIYGHNAKTKDELINNIKSND
jgi:mannose-6-phosphate isomerase